MENKTKTELGEYIAEIDRKIAELKDVSSKLRRIVSEAEDHLHKAWLSTFVADRIRFNLNEKK